MLVTSPLISLDHITYMTCIFNLFNVLMAINDLSFRFPVKLYRPVVRAGSDDITPHKPKEPLFATKCIKNRFLQRGVRSEKVHSWDKNVHFLGPCTPSKMPETVYLMPHYHQVFFVQSKTVPTCQNVTMISLLQQKLYSSFHSLILFNWRPCDISPLPPLTMF